MLYPFLGWLTDVYITRYRSVLFSFFLRIVGAVLMILASIVLITNHHSSSSFTLLHDCIFSDFIDIIL